MESRQGKDGMPETGVTFRKPEGSGLWKLFVESAPHPLGFEGTAWFAADGGLRTIEWRSTGQVHPARLNIAEISWEVSFSAVDVAGESLLAPAAASYAVKYRPEVRREDRTQATFTGFRRFAGMARMLE